MNGIIADTTTITIAPTRMIDSAIGIETETGIVIMTEIEMTTATGESHVETEMTRTEFGPTFMAASPELQSG
jgi:hypothetical protein